MNGLLQLFLRSNTATSSFGPRANRDRLEKRQIRIWGPNELAYGNHLVDPVDPITPRPIESRDSQVNLISSEKGRAMNLEPIRSPPPVQSPTRYNPLKSNAVNKIAMMPAIPAVPEVAEMQRSPKSQARKPSYSLFPTDAQSPTQAQPTLSVPQSIEETNTESVYDISDFTPPPRLLGPDGQPVSRHRRDSSVMSSATVQIGLRLSLAPQSSTTQPPSQTQPRESVPALPSTTYTPAPTSFSQPKPQSPALLPKPLPTSSPRPLPSPKTLPTSPRPQQSPLRRNSPLLQIQTQNLPSPTRPAPLKVPGPMPQFSPPPPPPPAAIQTKASLRPSPLASHIVATSPEPQVPVPVPTQQQQHPPQKVTSPSYDKTLPPIPARKIVSMVKKQMRLSSSDLIPTLTNVNNTTIDNTTTTNTNNNNKRESTSDVGDEAMVLSPTVYTPTSALHKLERNGSNKSAKQVQIGRSGSARSLREIKEPEERERRRGVGDWL